MDTDSFLTHMKTKNVYKNIAGNVKKRFHNSNFEINRPLPMGRNKKVNGFMKEKLGRQIIENL